MLDKKDRYAAIGWFAAGYLAAGGSAGDFSRDEEVRAREVAVDYVRRHRRGACLGCGSENVVLLSQFCERCHVPPEEVAPELFDDV